MSRPASFQPFSDLPAAQYEALKKDIERHGVLVPIVVDENGTTIDGHQRRRICADLKITCPTRVVPGLEDLDKQALAYVLNTLRRHFTADERRQAIGRLSGLGWSSRRIADALGVPKSTVHDAIRQVPESGHLPPVIDPATGEILSDGQSEAPSDSDGEGGRRSPKAPKAEATPPSPRVKGKDGKSYPAESKAPAEAHPTLVMVSNFGKVIELARHRLLPFDAGEVVDAFYAENDAERISSFGDFLRGWSEQIDMAVKRNTRLRSVQ